MTAPIFNLGIIRESRIDEYRTPLVPKHIEKLKGSYDNINIFEKDANSSKIKLLLNIFTDSLSLLIIIKISKKITKIESL